MSAQEHTFCKLPLLDGDASTSPQNIAISSVASDVGKLRELYRQDRAILNNLLYTAWGLLLRCYTGQERISYRVRITDSASPKRPAGPSPQRDSKLQFTFTDHESLSVCLERVRESSSGPDNESPAKIQTNTTIWVHDVESGDPSAVDHLFADAQSLIPVVSTQYVPSYVYLHIASANTELREKLCSSYTICTTIQDSR